MGEPDVRNHIQVVRILPTDAGSHRGAVCVSIEAALHVSKEIYVEYRPKRNAYDPLAKRKNAGRRPRLRKTRDWYTEILGLRRPVRLGQ